MCTVALLNLNFVDIKDFLAPSLAEVFEVVFGWLLKHWILYSYHGAGHNFSIIHVTVSASKMAKLIAKKERNCNCFGEVVGGILLQLVCLSACLLLFNNGLLGLLCETLFQNSDGKYNPYPVKILEVLMMAGGALVINQMNNDPQPWRR